MIEGPERDQLVAYVEGLRGRQLSAAEQNIDIVQLNSDLADGKERLRAAISRAQRIAVRRWISNDLRGFFAIPVTREIEKILSDLYDQGRQHGEAELRRAGVAGYAAWDDERKTRKIRDLITRLQQHLTRYEHRTIEQATSLDLGALSRAAVARALEKIPGALDVAGRMVSGALYAGLGAAFDKAAGQVDQAVVPVGAVGGGNGWEYTAVMDDRTCSECEPRDGTTYATWAEAQDDLPDGGPNPECLGDGRCRCRLAPVPL